MNQGLICCFNIALIVGRIVSIRGEQQGQDDRTDEDGYWEAAAFHDANYDGLGSDEKIITLFIFLFFAYIIALLGSLIAYVSWQDDRIMDQYLDKGLFVEGDVVSTEFTRGGGGGQKRICRGGWGDSGNHQKEYLVSVEYNRVLSDNYPIRIRKQLRVLEGELFYPNRPERNHTHPQNKSIDKLATVSFEGLASNACSFANCTSGEIDGPIESITNCPNMLVRPKPHFEIVAIAGKDPFFGNCDFNQGKKLELLVLPNHHLSALPVGHIERRLSNQYRLFSISFVCVTTSVAVFCFRLASQVLLDIQAEHDNNNDFVWGWTVFWMFVVLAFAQLPCIHGLMHGLIRQSLEKEYFEMGELIKGGLDDSSLSTGSDSFFRYRTIENLSCG